ncbi:uncharacterized protein LOC129761304 [Toxorhynchites rutilus septentrionalis]|uniref:uncharacterized protein LOC129761304 n=1 Tax=Toxorhynchites rutilus septentrionalis TaxID=329112 RepID=UPI00247B12AD|nr:uncharacterized protein LOC129761304 [Toxorhynchites rutilus septentrionalis]
MSQYDPLGLLSHFLIHGRVIIQDIWRTKAGWDDTVNEEILQRWQRWIKLFEELMKVSISRAYFPGVRSEEIEDLQVHVFVDASETAYACVAYFRAWIHGEYRTALVGAKPKVSPLKSLSVPRLELQAAIIGCRLMKTLCSSHSLPIKRRVFWTDSKTVLAWINSDHRRYRQFVACRIGEILTKSNTDEWMWIPTKQNVADEATKWGKGPSLDPESRWFVGPQFLRGPEVSWPRQPIAEETPEELKPLPCMVQNTKRQDGLIKWCRVSKFERVWRAIAFIYRFVENFRLNQRGQPSKNGHLTADELNQAQNALWRPVQQHLLTNLLLDWYHRTYLHANNETVVNEVRQRFHVPSLRIQLRKVAGSCMYCKVKKAKPSAPLMAPLPDARLCPFVRPFSYVGLDYFGPLQVKVGRSLVKRWVALFTCLTIRAVHLEIVHSLSTNSCKMAIRRFLVRLGSPLEIWSDNGTNFQGASRELKKHLEQIDQQLSTVFTNTNTKSIFNPPAAPHMGGSWERLVRSIKTAFAGLSTTRNPDDETLLTLLIEAEGVVNSRPLTFVPLENEAQEALTPNHFLLLSSRGVTQPPEPLTERPEAMRSNWKLMKSMVDEFWHRWVKEYLPTIACRPKWTDESKELKEGDLALIVDESCRNGWLRGRVVSVIHGRDGRVRQAFVNTQREYCEDLLRK